MIPLIGALVGPVINYFTEKSQGKAMVRAKRIDQVINAQDSTAAWEILQAGNSKYTWKSEFWTVVLAIPAIGAFIPGGELWIAKGFAALSVMPDFYQYWLGIAILTSFGVRFFK